MSIKDDIAREDERAARNQLYKDTKVETLDHQALKPKLSHVTAGEALLTIPQGLRRGYHSARSRAGSFLESEANQPTPEPTLEAPAPPNETPRAKILRESMRKGENLTKPLISLSEDSKYKLGGYGESLRVDAEEKREALPQAPEMIRGRGVFEVFDDPNANLLDKATALTNTIAEAAPPTLGGLALGATGAMTKNPVLARTGAALAASVMHTQAQGGIYEELLRDNPDTNPETLAKTARTYAPLVTALEYAPIGGLINRAPGVRKAFLAELAKGSAKLQASKIAGKEILTQGATEYLTEGSQKIVENAAKKVYNEKQEYLEGTGEEAFVGGVMGMLFGLGGAAGTYSSAKSKVDISKMQAQLDKEFKATRADALKKLNSMSGTQLVAASELGDQTLAQRGITKNDIAAAIQTNKNKSLEAQNLIQTLDRAPSDAVRQGLIQSIGGQVFEEAKPTQQAQTEAEKAVEAGTEAAGEVRVPDLEAIAPVAGTEADLSTTPQETLKQDAEADFETYNPDVPQSATVNTAQSESTPTPEIAPPAPTKAKKAAQSDTVQELPETEGKGYNFEEALGEVNAPKAKAIERSFRQNETNLDRDSNEPVQLAGKGFDLDEISELRKQGLVDKSGRMNHSQYEGWKRQQEKAHLAENTKTKTDRIVERTPEEQAKQTKAKGKEILGLISEIESLTAEGKTNRAAGVQKYLDQQMEYFTKDIDAALKKKAEAEKTPLDKQLESLLHTYMTVSDVAPEVRQFIMTNVIRLRKLQNEGITEAQSLEMDSNTTDTQKSEATKVGTKVPTKKPVKAKLEPEPKKTSKEIFVEKVKAKTKASTDATVKKSKELLGKNVDSTPEALVENNSRKELESALKDLGHEGKTSWQSKSKLAEMVVDLQSKSKKKTADLALMEKELTNLEEAYDNVQNETPENLENMGFDYDDLIDMYTDIAGLKQQIKDLKNGTTPEVLIFDDAPAKKKKKKTKTKKISLRNKTWYTGAVKGIQQALGLPERYSGYFGTTSKKVAEKFAKLHNGEVYESSVDTDILFNHTDPEHVQRLLEVLPKAHALAQFGTYGVEEHILNGDYQYFEKPLITNGIKSLGFKGNTQLENGELVFRVYSRNDLSIAPKKETKASKTPKKETKASKAVKLKRLQKNLAQARRIGKSKKEIDKLKNEMELLKAELNPEVVPKPTPKTTDAIDKQMLLVNKLTDLFVKRPTREVEERVDKAKAKLDKMLADQALGSANEVSTLGYTSTEALEANILDELGFKKLPKTIQVVGSYEDLPQFVRDALARGDIEPLMSMTGPRWTSALREDYIGTGPKTASADIWLSMLKKWTTDVPIMIKGPQVGTKTIEIFNKKTKQRETREIPVYGPKVPKKNADGTIVKTMGEMPMPVRDEVIFSGLVEFLEDHPGESITRTEIQSFLDKHGIDIQEELHGFNYRIARGLDLTDTQKTRIDELTEELTVAERAVRSLVTLTFTDGLTQAQQHAVSAKLLSPSVFDEDATYVAQMALSELVEDQTGELLLTPDPMPYGVNQNTLEALEIARKDYKNLKEDRQRELTQIRRNNNIDFDSDAHAAWSDMVLDGDNTGYRIHFLNMPIPQESRFLVLAKSGMHMGSYSTMEEAEAYVAKTKQKYPHLPGFNVKEISTLIDSQVFNSPHFRMANNMVHVRADVREGLINGQAHQVLFVNELQSDWHQAAAKGEGYRTPETPEMDRSAKLEIVGAVKTSIGALAESSPAQAKLQKDFLEHNLRGGSLKRRVFNLVNNSQERGIQTYDDVINKLQRRYGNVSNFEEMLSPVKKEIEAGLKASAEYWYFKNSVPDAPFKKNWVKLTIKRLIQQAVIEGKTAVAFPATIEQVSQIENYRNLKTLEVLPAEHTYVKNEVLPDGYALKAIDGGRHKVYDIVTPELFSVHASKAEAISEAYDAVGKLDDLPTVKKYYTYDQDVTPIINRYTKELEGIINSIVKPYGTKAQKVLIPNEDEEGIFALGTFESQETANKEVLSLEKTNPDSTYSLNKVKDGWEVVINRTGFYETQGFEITPELKLAAEAGMPMNAMREDRVAGVQYKDKMYFVADQIDPEQGIKGILVHEGGHWMRRNDPAYQKQYKALLEQMDSIAAGSRTSKETRAVLEAYDRAFAANSDRLSDESIREESLYYYLQDQANQNQSLYQKFISLVKQFVFKHLGRSPKQLNMTGHDLAKVTMNDIRKSLESHAEDTRQILTAQDAMASKGNFSEKDKADFGPRTPKQQEVLDILDAPKPGSDTEARKVAINQAADNVIKHSKNPAAQALARSIKSSGYDGADWVRDENTQTTGLLSRIFSGPEYTFAKKGAAAKKFIEAALESENIQHAIQNEILENFPDLSNYIKENYKKDYTVANDYINYVDKTGEAFRLKQAQDGSWDVEDIAGNNVGSHKSRDEASEILISKERRWLLDTKKFPIKAADYIAEFRRVAHRDLMAQISDLENQVVMAARYGMEELHVGGKGSPTVSELIAQSGDLEGSYMPRIRENKDYIVRMEKDNADPILMTADVVFPGNTESRDFVNKARHFLNRNLPFGIGKDIKAYEKQGYTVTSIKPTQVPSEVVFDGPGLISNAEALMKAAEANLDEGISEAEKEAMRAINERLTVAISNVFKVKGNMSSRKQRSKTYTKGFETDSATAMTTRATRTAAGLAKRKTATDMLQALTGRDRSFEEWQQDNKEGTYEEYRGYVKTQAVDATEQKNLYDDLRTYMTYFLKPNSPAARAIGSMRLFAVTKYLGFKVSSPAVNMTNMVLAVPATISAHSGLGMRESFAEVTNAAERYAAFRSRQGIKDSLSPSAWKKLEGFVGTSLQKTGTALTKEISDADWDIFRDISIRGWDSAHFNMEATRLTSGKVSNWINNYTGLSMYLFGASEKANRAMTIFAAYKAIQKKDGSLGHEALMVKAKHASDRAHGAYGKATKPWWVQKWPALDLIYTFQKFQHNYLMNTAEILGKGIAGDKNAWGALTHLLLSGAVLAGPRAGLAAPVLIPVVSALLKSMGYEGEDPEEDFYKAFESKTTPWLARLARHGLLGTAGVNMQGSLMMNAPAKMEDPWYKALGGAPINALLDVVQGIDLAAQGQISKGFEKASPIGQLGTAAKAYRVWDEGYTSGGYMPQFYGPEQIRQTGYESLVQGLFGFRSSRISSMTESLWAEKLVEKDFSEARGKIMDHLRQWKIQGGSREELKDIYTEIAIYNERVGQADRKYNVTKLTYKQIRANLKQSLKPSRAERER